MTKSFLRLALVAGAGLALAACNPVTIKNPFGGVPLVLTGNLQGDMPGILAYEQAVKQGIAADAASAKQFLIGICPTVQQVAAIATGTDPASISSSLGITLTAAQKQVSNAQQGAAAATAVCAGAAATDVKTAAASFVTAAKIVYGWFAKKPVAAAS
jgi:hypothetical protein